MDEIFKYLAAAGDGVTVLILYALWRFDRRLLSMEVQFGAIPKRKNDGDQG